MVNAHPPPHLAHWKPLPDWLGEDKAVDELEPARLINRAVQTKNKARHVPHRFLDVLTFLNYRPNQRKEIKRACFSMFNCTLWAPLTCSTESLVGTTATVGAAMAKRLDFPSLAHQQPMIWSEICKPPRFLEGLRIFDFQKKWTLGLLEDKSTGHWWNEWSCEDKLESWSAAHKKHGD